MRKDKKKERFEELDDGRPIANMNVEGMPWYVEEKPEYQSSGNVPPLDKRQTRQFIASALVAALAVAAVFLVCFALFILFCTKVWFR